jgi:hypothetical protein
MKIEIPFIDFFKEKILFEDASCTSRIERHGIAKDTFSQWGIKFMLTKVTALSLGYVIENLYRQEGFFSPVDFIAYWKKLHPREGYNPHQIVFVHFFKRMN